MRVTDSGTPALADWQIVQITVGEINAAPQLDPIGDQAVDELVTLTFTATASDSDLPANDLSYSLDAGAPSGAGIDPLSGVFTWTPSEAQGLGQYTVIVQVADDGLPVLENYMAVTIIVNEVNVPFLVDAGTDQLAAEGDILTFTGTYTDPGLLAVSGDILWDFGDGTMVVGTLRPTHAYGSDGWYTVTLSVDDRAGGYAQDSLLVTVNNVAPQLSLPSDQTILFNQPLNLAASLTDPGWLDAHLVTIDWGDGLTETLSLEPGMLEFGAAHTYATSGVYTIVVTASDDHQATTGTFQTTVQALSRMWLPIIVSDIIILLP